MNDNKRASDHERIECPDRENKYDVPFGKNTVCPNCGYNYANELEGEDI